MPKRMQERLQAIMNGIMSLVVNDCNTLECLIQQGPEAVFEAIACKVRPTLQVCLDEYDDVQAERLRLSRESEERRQVLELIYSNAAGQLPKEVQDRLCQVLGFCPAK